MAAGPDGVKPLLPPSRGVAKNFYAHVLDRDIDGTGRWNAACFVAPSHDYSNMKHYSKVISTQPQYNMTITRAGRPVAEKELIRQWVGRTLIETVGN